MKVHILYGSATGNAEHIAKDLAASINTKSLSSEFSSAECMEMDQFKKKKLFELWSSPPTAATATMTKHAVIAICSTTGNGDAPENAGRFVRFLKRKPPATTGGDGDSLPLPLPLQHVAYAVLGLGDTNYDQFCASSKLIDRKLNEWGGTRAMDLACADEATGLEGAVEPWLESVLGRLAEACLVNVNEKATAMGEGKEEVALVDLKEEVKGDYGVSLLPKEMEAKLAVSTEIANNIATQLEATTTDKTSTNTISRSTPSAASSSSKTTPSNTTNIPNSAHNNQNIPATKSTTTTTSSSAQTKNSINNNQINNNNNNNTTIQTKSSSPLFILYGSATGNAEHIAKELASTYEKTLTTTTSCYFPSVICCTLNDFKKKCLATWETPPSTSSSSKHGVIIVCSTTGNADAPENADRFIRYLKRKTTQPAQPFQHCAHAVLGLGDTNYDQFCAMGKVLDKRLHDCGGTRAMDLACADEATGLEEVVEPWTESVVGRLVEVCSGRAMMDGTDTTDAIADVNAVAENGTNATTTAAVVVTPSPSIHVEEETSAEEKKMDHHDETTTTTTTTTKVEPPSTTTSSIGVITIRNLLSLSSQDPLPSVSNSSLPALVSSLSSCELIHEEEQPQEETTTANTGRRSRGNSIADNMTVSSTSSGFHFTLTNPYESTILDARYLTKGTDVECARKVGEMFGSASTATTTDEEKVDDHDEKLIQAMGMYDEHFPLAPTPNNDKSVPQIISEEDQIQYSKNGKRVIEMTLSLPDDFTLEYEPGDSVGLVVPNTPSSTNFILSMLQQRHGILPTQKISVDANNPITVGDAIRNTIDLCSPLKKKRLFLLSQYATDPEEQKTLHLLCSSSSSSSNNGGGDIDLYQSYVEDQRRTIIDILKEFPSCQNITLEGLFGILPAIPPRYYSVCSSPLRDRELLDGHHFHLKVAFSVVDYLTPSAPNDPNGNRRIAGLATRHLECICSSYLSNQASSTSPSIFKPTVKIFPKPSHDFRQPADLSTPLILIGPGTGIAPFLGFLSHRQAQIASLESKEAAEVASEGTWRGGYELDPEDLNISNRDARGLNLAVDYMRNQSVGETDLFFGCRTSDHDWLYETELNEFQSLGIVSNLYTAFSREKGKEKTYVQTIMEKDDACGSRLVDMISEKHASVYVCGDGNAMGREVQETITKLLARKKYGTRDVSEEEAMEMAVAYVDQMKTFGRFVLDIWS